MRGPVAIVGVGLMGGSLGLALRARAGVTVVRGFDPDPAAMAAGHRAGAITHTADDLAEAVGGCEAVFLAAPVGELSELARYALAHAPDDCVVTDVGSTKTGVAAGLDASERERFIGGHPVCGSEAGGVAGAREDLFEGATYFLTPAPEARPELFTRLHGLVSAIGARPVAVDAEAHDGLMATVSHLPHVIASALIHQAAATAPKGREALLSAGPSFADLTRVAGANPPLWADILVQNRSALRRAIADHLDRLREVDAALDRGDRDWLLSWFSDAASGRERLRAVTATPAIARPWHVVVEVPNRPGVISEIAVALGHAHLNIEDLTLHPATEEQGELTLVLGDEGAARRAVELIAGRGFAARAHPVP